MKRRLKLVTSLSTLTASSALALAGCSGGEGEGEGEGAAADQTYVASEGEGEGEGAAVSEGESEGEGEGGAAGDPAADDVEYLYRLGMIRGHLIAFIELYRAGETDMAATHVKHPESELYAALAPAFTARDRPGFAGALQQLVDAAASGENVETTYEATIVAIRANAPESDPRTVLLAIARLMSTAAEEFEIGVSDDGEITDPHEYQDAFGFLTAAREILSEVETSDINATEAIAVSHEQIDLSLAMFDGLIATETQGSSSTIYGAASRIEIAGLGL